MLQKYISYENLRRFKGKLDPIIAGKQEQLTAVQLNAVNSGVNSAKINIYDNIHSIALGSLEIVKSVSLNSNTLVFKFKNLDDVQLSETTIDLPYGSTVSDLSYSQNTKQITLQLNGGEDPFVITLANLVTHDDLEDFKTAIETDLGYIYQYDDEAVIIDHAFQKMADKTYLANATSIKLTIPTNIDLGFESAVTIKTGDAVPTFRLDNLSPYPVKMMQFGSPVLPANYIPATHSTITFLLYNDKINNNILIYEVHD